jgi:hypothetical protein
VHDTWINMLIEEVPAGDARVDRFKDIHGFPLINDRRPRVRIPTRNVHEDVALPQPPVCNHRLGETTRLGERDDRYGSRTASPTSGGRGRSTPRKRTPIGERERLN